MGTSRRRRPTGECVAGSHMGGLVLCIVQVRGPRGRMSLCYGPSHHCPRRGWDIIMKIWVLAFASLITLSTMAAISLVVAQSAQALVAGSDGTAIGTSEKADRARKAVTPALSETPGDPVPPSSPAPAPGPAAAPSPSRSASATSPVMVMVTPPRVTNAGDAPRPVPTTPPAGSLPAPSTSSTVLGGQPATCTQVTSNGQFLTPCGTNPEPRKVYCNSLAVPVASPTPAHRLAPLPVTPGVEPMGLYVQVTSGSITFVHNAPANNMGGQNFSAGQFGFTP